MQAHELFEPESGRDGMVGDGEALASIAISLKRIADIMAGNETHCGIVLHMANELALAWNRR
jgi:hypothetical protein